MNILSNEDLATVIKEEAKKVENGAVQELEMAAKRFRDLGIKAGMHTGCGDEMNDASPGQRLEWFAGQLVEMADNKSLLAVNSWINTVEKFTAL